MRSYLIVTTVFLDALAVVQLVRLVMGWPVTVASVSIPVWVSGIAVVVAGSLAAWGIRLILKTRNLAVAT